MGRTIRPPSGSDLRYVGVDMVNPDAAATMERIAAIPEIYAELGQGKAPR